MPAITPNLWFDTESLEVAEYYCSVFPNSKINNVSYYNEAGPREEGMVMTVDFTLDGNDFTAINGGPQFKPDEAVSFLINCKDQAEVDYYWDKLTQGGQEVQCGWLKDRYGVSWQVVPDGLVDALTHSDANKSKAAMQAMLSMKKIDLAEIKAAADQA